MRAITVVVLLCLLLAMVYEPVFFARWDQQAKDLLTDWAGGGEPSNGVVMVAIDDRALEQFGRWPWPRDRLNILLQSIQQNAPDTIVLDMMFPEADLAKPAAPSAPPEATTNDDLLAATFRQGRFVTGFQFRFAPESSGPSTCQPKPLRLTIADTESRREPAFFAASGVSCSVEQLSAASLAHGFLNAAPDSDGVLRRVPLVVEYAGRAYPSLALAAYLASRRIQEVQLWTNSLGAKSLRVNDLHFPLDSKSGLLLRFRKPSDFPRVSAAELMNGKAQGVLRGKIVVVGMSALGLQDVVATIVDPMLPGVYVHAVAIDNLLRNDAYSVPRGALAGELALMLAMGVGSALLVSRAGAVWAPLVIVSLVAATWLGCAAAVRGLSLVISPFPATIALLGNLTLLSTWRVATERRREEQQLRTTRQFILDVLMSLSRIRDLETGAHMMRVQRYTKVLCETIALHPRYRRVLTPATIQLIYELVPLHDIGKVAIPDRILRHPGRLVGEDFEIIKLHVTHGYTVFADAARRTGLKDEAALRLASEIILAHHERWDGTGYPLGLIAEATPLVGRIAALTDVYDALVCKRIYKEPWTHEAAVEFIARNRGTHFDPVVVDAFLKMEKEIHAIKTSLDDESVSDYSPAAASPR